MPCLASYTYGQLGRHMVKIRCIVGKDRVSKGVYKSGLSIKTEACPHYPPLQLSLFISVSVDKT